MGRVHEKTNNAKRKMQARRFAEIYEEAKKRSDYVIVAGDTNDLPESDAMQPLISGTDLKYVMSHHS